MPWFSVKAVLKIYCFTWNLDDRTSTTNTLEKPQHCFLTIELRVFLRLGTRSYRLKFSTDKIYLHPVLLGDATVRSITGKESVFQINYGFTHFFITSQCIIIIDWNFQILFLRQEAAEFIHSKHKNCPLRLLLFEKCFLFLNLKTQIEKSTY